MLIAAVAILFLLGFALLDGKLWKMMAEQRRHNQSVEQLLAEIRDRQLPMKPVTSSPAIDDL